ncbi:MAG: carboxylating nicotinate-nucleotide diphosphorylase [Anaerolineales bacterium]|nr:carboxylating nicotinate-nucleotide diphosphorylase [Anaerolineales bacterium]
MQNEILESIRHALDEDIRTGDVTTNSIVPADALMNGKIIAKQNGVIAGLDIARAAFHLLDDSIQFKVFVDEGQRITAGSELVHLRGHSRPLLTGERTALNYLGRMSGIATLTRQFVDAVSGTKAVILDTRKTAPGLRTLDKLAVKLGGGENHRIGLFDMIIIKDNHIDFAGGIKEAVRRARDFQSGLEIEVETRTLEDVKVALNLGVERILLDNMSIEMMNEAIRLTNGRAKLEASGNVSLETVRQIAETGVDYISVGALTHSSKVFDFSLQWTREQ